MLQAPQISGSGVDAWGITVQPSCGLEMAFQGYTVTSFRLEDPELFGLLISWRLLIACLTMMGGFVMVLRESL